MSQGPVTASVQRAFDTELKKFEEAEQKNVSKDHIILESQDPTWVSTLRAFDEELNKFGSIEEEEHIGVIVPQQSGISVPEESGVSIPAQSGPRDVAIECDIESECAELDDNSEKPMSLGEHTVIADQDVLKNIIVDSPESSSQKGESGEEYETESSYESDDFEEEIPSASTPYKSNEEEISSATTPKTSNASKKSVPSSSASDSLVDLEYIPSTSVEPSSTSDIITTQVGPGTLDGESESDDTSNDDFEVTMHQLRKRARIPNEQLQAQMKACNRQLLKVNSKGANPTNK